MDRGVTSRRSFSYDRFPDAPLVVNGVHSPVLIGGTGATREAVVFVHGNPDAGSDWEPLMKHVAEFATVVAPDMPGFGDADKNADHDYTVAAYAAHLGGLIDQLGNDRCTWSPMTSAGSSR